MIANNAPKPRARRPLGLIGMLALVVIVERYVDRRNTDLSTMYAIEWRQTGQSVKHHATKANIFCFGTSLTKMGVSPKVLEEKLGKPTYNFSMSGAQPFALYTMLSHVLDAGGKPEAIIVEFKWSALAVDCAWNERVLPEIATLGELAELAIAARDPVFFARLAMVSKLPTYRCREEIRANILAAIQGKEPNRNHGRAIMARNAIANHGANHSPKAAFNGEISPDDPHLFPKDWKCNPICELYIHKFLDLAASRSVPVFWLIPPVAPKTQERRNEIGAEDRYTVFIKSVVARHPTITVVDARYSHFAVDAFLDTTHLNRDGAVALSTALAEAMAAKLGAPRPNEGVWVSLPPYRPGGDGSKIEDMSESWAAMAKERMNARR